jgi:hypothetical protein
VARVDLGTIHVWGAEMNRAMMLGTVVIAVAGAAQAEVPGTVLSHAKISDTAGGFDGILDDDDDFGSSLVSLGDFDGDGVVDLAVGARLDDDGCDDCGAVWILFLNADGTVKAHQKISRTEGNFDGVLMDADYFGSGSAALGDLDGDSVGDLAVGAWGADDAGVISSGAVWILFLNVDGTVKAHQKISNTAGGFPGGQLGHDFRFGSSVTSLGDLDGDALSELAVAAIWTTTTGLAWMWLRWAIWMEMTWSTSPWERTMMTMGGSITVPCGCCF